MYNKKNINKLSFEERLKVFENETRLAKYNTLGEVLTFPDGTLMGHWFYNNKKKVFELSSIIKEEYDSNIKRQKISFETKLMEFYNQPDLKKFAFKNRDIKFKNGVYMSIWWSNNKEKIMNLKSKVAKETVKQFNEYQRICKRKTFETSVIEFLECSNMEKYNVQGNVKFKNGSDMGLWFYSHKDRILSSFDKDCIKVKEEYENVYLNSFASMREKQYYDKLVEFEQEQDLIKFNNNKRTLLFSDGRPKSTWFYSHYDELLNSTDDLSKSVQKQFKEYKKQYGISNKVLFIDRINEFIKEENVDKFNPQLRSCFFSDGASMNTWWNNYFKRVFQEYEDLSSIIKKQYESYRKIRDEEVKSLSTIKLDEFVKEENLHKFSSSNKTCLFSDGAFMSRWFSYNKNKIFECNDEKCIEIKKQYEDYKQRKHVYAARLKEFEQEQNLSKFNISNTYLRFKDGTLMSRWFRNNKKKLLISNEEDAINILVQFYTSKNDEENIIKYKDKLNNSKVVK